MKKVICIMCVAVMIFALCSCEKDVAADNETKEIYETDEIESTEETIVSEETMDKTSVETVEEITAQTTAESATELEKILPLPEDSMQFTFLSGAGAWRTSLIVVSDGTFYGLYRDSEAGEVGEDYPRGSNYICEFTGKFGDIEKVDEHSYKMRISELITKNEVGEIWIEDDIQYIASEPHGLAGGEEFVFYLPDTPLDSVSEEFLTWWPYRGEISKDKVIDETLSCYGILNVATDHGFFAGY